MSCYRLNGVPSSWGKSKFRTALKSGNMAFTLTELLVVIAIIGIVAAVLVPVLRGAQKKAQESKCASNIRQLGMALLQFSADNDGMMFYPPNGSAWWEKLKPALGKENVTPPGGCLICPTSWQLKAGKSLPGGKYLSYGLNDEVLTDVTVSNTPTNIKYLPAISGQSKLILAAEGLGPTAYTIWLTKSRPAFPDYHNGKFHAVFLDGHVESLDRNVMDADQATRRRYLDPNFYK
jgi:prepilin-type N-terminal cleavage/methylation domain-containing protein/prepilin-type processing-associated H-X9-DG protein